MHPFKNWFPLALMALVGCDGMVADLDAGAVDAGSSGGGSAATVGGGSATGGGSAAVGGGAAAEGGGSAVSGGGSGATGGGSVSTGGGTGATGGGSSVTGGGSAVTGGGSSATGGGSGATGGGSVSAGGGTGATGGGSSVTGGGSAATGGGTATTNLTFTASTAYIERPFAGSEDWNGQDYADIPTVGNRQQRNDYYFRFSWTQLEGATQGSYNWARFDQEIQSAISKHQKFSFGIMTVCPGGCDSFNGPVNYGGASAIFPQYVHTLMQSETVKDWSKDGTWVPNWNSPNYLSRFEALLNAVAAHIQTGSYMGVNYRDVINYIDIRGYGSWGEWHSAGIVDNMNQYPTGMRPTVATYKRIIDAHISAFPNEVLVVLLSAFDAEWFNNTLTPNEVTAYALSASNARGLLGYRRDQWGITDQYVHDYLENNNRSWGSSGPFKDIIMERWKYAPAVGEPFGPGADLSDLVAQVNRYHAVSIGNGNFAQGNAAANDRMRQAVNAAGYYYSLTGGSITANGNTLNVRLNWANTGLTPTYEKWDVVLTVKSSTGTVLGTHTSAFTPTLKLPGATPMSNDTFTVSSLPSGYQVFVNVKNAYRSMPLFITTAQQTDGSYRIK